MKFWLLALYCIACAAPAYALRDIVIIQNMPAAQDQTLRLMSADPAPGQTLGQAPVQVSLTFSQPIRVDKSHIRVINMYGAQLTDDITGVDGNTVTVMLPKLGNGRYTVKWRVRCQCEQDTEISDTFRFTVK